MVHCSEGVREALGTVVADLDEQIKMKDILVRLHRQNLEEVDEEFESEDFIVGLSYDRAEAFAAGPLTLEDLTEQEMESLKKAFNESVLTGGEVVSPWNPWWESGEARDVRLSPEGTLLVQLIHDSESKCNGDTGKSIPAAPCKPIPPLKNLTSRIPSDSIILHLIDVLFWYCLVLRLANGDYECADVHLLQVLASCSVAFSNKRDENTEENTLDLFMGRLYEICMQHARQHLGYVSRGVAIGTTRDIANILSLGRTGVILSLQDSLEMISRAKSTYCHADRRSGSHEKSISLMEKKMLYFQSWTNDYCNDLAPVFSSELERIYKKGMNSIQEPTLNIKYV